MASPPRKRAKTLVPPPPSIGAALRPKAKPEDERAEATTDQGGAAEAEAEVAPSAADASLDDSETSRWPSLNEAIAHDDDVDDDPFDAPLPPAQELPKPVSVPPEIEPSESATGLRVPSASESSGTMRVVSTDGWDVPEVPPGDLAMPSLPRPPGLKTPKPPRPASTVVASGVASSEPGDGGGTAGGAESASSEPPPLPVPEPSVPRLPVPGMLRDGAEPRASDFRTKGHVARASTPAAMPPPKGVAPPKRGRDGEDEPARIKPGDTATFVAEVAVELMAEAKAAKAEMEAEAAAEAAAAASTGEGEAEAEDSRKGVVPVVAAAAAVPTSDEAAAVGAASPVPPSEPREKRPMLLALLGGVAAAVLGVIIWASFSGKDEPTEVAGAPATSDDDEDDGSAPAAVAPDDDEPAAAPILDVAPGTDTGDEALVGTGTGGSTSGGSTSGGESSSGGDTTGGEDEEPEVVASSSPRPRTSRKPKAKPRPTPTADPQPQPKPQPKPQPTESASPAELLAQARAAYRKGQGSRAYSLATKANRMQPTGDAAELRTLAACLMKDGNKARSALKGVPLLQRGKVRGTCKSKHDVRIPL